MATWKCEVKMKFGKYSAHVWKATERAGVPVADGLGSSKAAVEQVLEAVQKAGFSEGDDEIIFRDSAYGSLSELRHVMSRAPY
ncbi:MAG: hypothetical protein H6747_09055 [Deltaproteobacteria bacterium]|nr:hypothetical protein [Deltaproteobacteria bacterium]